MASALDQLLRPGERVIYRTPREWLPRSLRWDLAFGVVVLGLAVMTGLIEFEAEDRPTYFTLLAMGVLLGSGIVFESRSIELAVTDQRLLRTDTTGEHLKLRSIDLEDISAIDFSGRVVRVTKASGRAVALEHAQYAPEFALAAAQTTGQPRPWTPRALDKVAIYLNVCVGAAAYLTVLLLTIRALSAAELIPIPFPQCLLLLVPILLASLAAWLAVEPLGLFALRLFRTPNELRAWISHYALGQKSAEQSDKPDWFTQFRLRYLNLVIDQIDGGPPKPAEPGAARHGE